MPIQPYRTRTLRRVKVKTPSGKVVIHYKKRKPKIAHCSQCKKPLGGVPRNLPYKIRQLPKTQRRPERIYGGVLCPYCLKQKLKGQYQKKFFPLEIGRVCIKNSGREAGKYCVIIEKKDDNFAIVDGQVRRKRCNINHLITLEKKLDIKKGASTADVTKAFKKIDIEIKKTKKKTQKERPKKQKKQKKEVKEKPKKEKIKKKIVKKTKKDKK